MPAIGNLVQQKITSTGTGIITLGDPVEGFTTFGSVFTDGEKVFYAIRDGINKEVGYGTFDIDTNSLSRDVIFEKLEAGIFSKNPGTGINTTVNGVVMSTPSVQALTNTYPTWRRIPCSQVYNDGSHSVNSPAFAELVGGSTVMVPVFADNATESIPVSFIMPFDIPSGGSIRVQANLFTTGVTSAPGRFGLTYILSNDGDEVVGSNTLYTEPVLSGVADTQQLIEFSTDIPALPSMVITGMFFRDGTHGNDLYTGGVKLASISAVYQTPLIGTPKAIGDFYNWS